MVDSFEKKWQARYRTGLLTVQIFLWTKTLVCFRFSPGSFNICICHFYCGGKTFPNYSSGIVFFIVSSVLTVGAGSELRESDPNCGSRIRNGQEFSRWRKILSVLAAETLFYRIWIDTFLICTRFIFASLRQKMNFHPDQKQVERGAFFNWEKTMLKNLLWLRCLYFFLEPGTGFK